MFYGAETTAAGQCQYTRLAKSPASVQPFRERSGAPSSLPELQALNLLPARLGLDDGARARQSGGLQDPAVLRRHHAGGEKGSDDDDPLDHAASSLPQVGFSRMIGLARRTLYPSVESFQRVWNVPNRSSCSE